MKEPYEVKVKCTNCGFEDWVEIFHGVRVSDEKCPTCGCKDLVRVSTPAPESM